jgi:hypothetical protein
LDHKIFIDEWLKKEIQIYHLLIKRWVSHQAQRTTMLK